MLGCNLGPECRGGVKSALGNPLSGKGAGLAYWLNAAVFHAREGDLKSGAVETPSVHKIGC
jgi:hypothetical protein